jgi:hypothetical protein
MRYIVTLLCLLVGQLNAQQGVSGAHVSVSRSGGKVTFTVFNNSDKNIRSWFLGTKTYYADGHLVGGGHSEDYGPPSERPAKLPPGGKDVVVDANDYSDPNITKVTAVVTVVIYDDNTARATDDAQLAQYVFMRRRGVYTLNLLIKTLQAAMTDDEPVARAKRDLRKQLTSSDNELLDNIVLDEIKNLDRAPAGREREHVQAMLDIYQRMPADTADIRRLP